MTIAAGDLPAVGAAMDATSQVALAEELSPGTRVIYAHTPCTILSGPTQTVDRFGATLLVFQARREDTGAVGALLFGRGGMVDLDPTPTPA